MIVTRRNFLETAAGHLKQGGSDPVKIFADYGGHLLFPHFKDHYSGPPAKVGDGKRQRDVWFSELGLGDVDFPGVLTQMSKHGYQGWIGVGRLHQEPHRAGELGADHERSAGKSYRNAGDG